MVRHLGWLLPLLAASSSPEEGEGDTMRQHVVTRSISTEGGGKQLESKLFDERLSQCMFYIDRHIQR